MKRFFIERLDEKERTVFITGKEFHHLKHVLRLQKGDDVILFDGKGNEALGKIESIGKNEARIIAGDIYEPPGENIFDIILAQGLAKGEKMDIIVQKATELGVSRIIPFATLRTIPKLTIDHIAKKTQRWQRIALEAAKQCRRGIVPKVERLRTFAEILSGHENHLKIIPWEKEKKNTLKDILSPFRDITGKALNRFAGSIVLIGPEGGFTDAEIAEAKGKGFIPITLGPRILRTETAAISILTIIQYELGDMGKTQKTLTKSHE